MEIMMLTLKQLAKIIEDNDWVYLDGDGQLDREFIMKKFVITSKQFEKLEKILRGEA